MLHSAHASTCVAALVASTALAACNAPDTLTPPTTASAELSTLGKPPSQTLYTVADLGVPTGFSSSVGTDVNDAGTVIGLLDGSSSPRAFVLLLGGAFRVLPPGSFSFANAISNGTFPTYIVGSADLGGGANVPVFWELFGPSVGSPFVLPNGGAGSANGVNDDGDAVGWSFVQQGGTSVRVGMYWDAYGSATSLTPPLDYLTLDGADVNNAQFAVFNAARSPTRPDRAYLTSQAFVMFPLDPPSDLPQAATYADAMSEVAGVTIYVAGRVQISSTGEVWPARWTINLTTTQRTVDVRREWPGASLGVSNDGTWVGQQSVHGQVQTAFAWLPDGSAYELPLPRATRFPTARSISPSGNHIVGSGDIAITRSALLWTETGP